MPTITGTAGTSTGPDGNGTLNASAGLYARSGTEFIVNSVTTGDQSAPQVAALASGGFVAVWVDGDHYNPGGRAVAQLYDASGNKVGGEIEIKTAENIELHPQVTALSGGSFAAIWYDYDSGRTMMQIFDAAGNRIGGEIDPDRPGLVSSAALANDRFVLVSTHDATGQIFDGAGNAIGGTFSLVDLNTSAGSVVEGLAGGGFVVASKVHDYYELGGRGIALQLFDANGGKVGSQIEFSTDYGNPSEIDVAGLSDGGFVLTWTDSVSNWIFTRVFDSAGNPVTGIIQAVAAAGEVAEPDIVATADGGFFLAWREGSANFSNVSGQFFDPTGAASGQQFLISQLTDQFNRNHETPSSALLASGEIVTLWHGAGPGDPRTTGLPPEDSGGGIRGQILAPLSETPVIELASSANEVNEAAIENLPALLLSAGSEAINAQYSFTLVSDSTGGAFALDGDRLVLVDGGRLDAESASVAAVTIRVTDNAGNAVDHILSLSIGDDVLEWRYAAGQETLVSVEHTWTQSQSVLAPLDMGGFVVVWTHGGWNGDGTGTAVYAQLYDAARSAVGDPFLVNTYTSSIQQSPSVTSLDGGSFLVVWSSSASAYGDDIRGQRFNSDGTKLGDEIVVVATEESSGSPSVAALAGGGAAVAWVESTGSGSEIHLQILDASGSPLGSVHTVGSTVTGWRTTPDLAALDDGSILVSWTDSTAPNAPGSVRVQRLDSAGSTLGGELQVSPAAAGSQSQSTIAAIDGGFVLTWKAGLAIKAQIYSLSGQPIGDEIAVAALGSDPFVAMLPSGGFAITWTGPAGAGAGDLSGTSIMMKTFDATGSVIGASQAINAVTEGNQGDSSLSVLSDGTLALVWTDQSRSIWLGDVKLRLLEPQQSATYGTGGVDMLAAPAGGGFAFGKAGNDSLTGSSGDDTLDGGAGADTLNGGAGDDHYIVDRSTDVVTELAGRGNDTVSSAVTYVLAAHVENLVLTGSAAIGGTGNTLANTITGNAGANTLNGGFGADTLRGGLGDDTYVVDSAADIIAELVGEGADRVFASASYVLGAGVHVEQLYTNLSSGTAAIDLTGNELANALLGNAGANVLDGGAGADRLAGLGGNDSYVVDNAGDVVVEAAGGGSDRVYARVSYALAAGAEVEQLHAAAGSSTDAIDLTGNEIANALFGNAGANALSGLGGNDTLDGGLGNDRLDGGAGSDTLRGGAGDDLYVVNGQGDAVVEAAGQGTDTVYTSASYALANTEVEVLRTTSQGGTAAINLTGNGFSQTVLGNNGANTLSGGSGGDDVLYGFAGDDSYVVNGQSDHVIEAAGQGSDTVFTSVHYGLALGAEIEFLRTTSQAGTTGINLVGSGTAQTIVGNAGDNTIDGRGGADALYGMGGADSFVFRTALGAGNVDTVADYSVADDRILLDDAVFTGLALGALAAGAFNTGAAAVDADDRIIYNSATGALLFDADGSGAGAAIQFAALGAGLAMTAAEFVVI